MAESKLRDLSVEFAVEIIKFCDDIKGHYSLVNQLERSATSIGAKCGTIRRILISSINTAKSNK